MRSAAVTVTTSATEIVPNDVVTRHEQNVIVQNNGTGTIYLGGPDVTSANGVLLGAGETLGIVMFPSQILYGISAGSEEARYLVVD